MLDNKTLKRSLAVHFQSYPLALAEKEQLATASAVFGNYDSTQSAMPIPVMRNAESIRQKAEPIRQNIRFRNMKYIQSDRSILGLFVQGLVSHIINMYICTRSITCKFLNQYTFLFIVTLESNINLQPTIPCTLTVCIVTQGKEESSVAGKAILSL